jgi:Fe-S-cluster-containing hydrogenase component 2
MTFTPDFGLGPREDEEGLFSRHIDGQLVRLDKPTEEDFGKEVKLQIDGWYVTIRMAGPLKDAQGNIVLDIKERPTPQYTTILDAVVKLNSALDAVVKLNVKLNAELDAFVELNAVKLNAERTEKPVKPYVPTLCHQPHMTPVAVCRLCVVQVYGQRRGVPACQQQVKDGMQVFTMHAPKFEGEQVRRSVGILTELLITDHLRLAPAPAPAEDLAAFNEIEQIAIDCKVSSRFGLDVFASGDVRLPEFGPPVDHRVLDSSSPVFLVDHTACILCDRCSRACNEVKNNHVIGRTGKGRNTGIGFDLNDKMFESSCVQCGECMISCPTSAITFKPAGEVKSKADSTSEPVPLAELIKDPFFAEVPPKLLLWQKGLVRRLRRKAGYILCRQGEPGNVAFRIKEGELGITRRDGQGRLGELIRSTVVDQIVGEMACLSGTPRNADISVLNDAEVWEVRRNVLDRMMRSPAQHGFFEQIYRERALPTALRASELFSDLPPGQVESLKSQLRFVRVSPGQKIFMQHEEGDHLYLIRLGHVRVGISRDGQEARYLYRGPGTVIGEMGLLAISEKDANRTEEEVCSALRDALALGDLPPGKRTATCEALDHVELARIDRLVFLDLVRQAPTLLSKVVRMALGRLREETPQMRQFLDEGLYQGQSLLTLDLTKCTRCDECTKACIQQHGIESHGQPITRLLREGLRFGDFLVATACRSCKDAYCMIGCPVDAIHRGKHQQIVIEDHCIGCGLCARNCPYDNISMQPNSLDLMEAEDPERPGQTRQVARAKAATCDLCDADGQEERLAPRCVYACPHDAANRMTGEDLLRIVMG